MMHLTACVERGSGQTVSQTVRCMTQLVSVSALHICEVSFLRQKQPSATHDEKFYAVAENGKMPLERPLERIDRGAHPWLLDRETYEEDLRVVCMRRNVEVWNYREGWKECFGDKRLLKEFMSMRKLRGDLKQAQCASLTEYVAKFRRIYTQVCDMTERGLRTRTREELQYRRCETVTLATQVALDYDRQHNAQVTEVNSDTEDSEDDVEEVILGNNMGPAQQDSAEEEPLNINTTQQASQVPTRENKVMIVLGALNSTSVCASNLFCRPGLDKTVVRSKAVQVEGFDGHCSGIKKVKEVSGTLFFGQWTLPDLILTEWDLGKKDFDVETLVLSLQPCHRLAYTPNPQRQLK
ncbi:hypothetical protein DYB28_005803 [Aphanomyces astaci]|uniref:Retrotransposon gag domain-containing protein n=1 Tax=Aphanomyces astaci TaxID=112090 RepID=A0A9X8H7F1_APHAT|nr:hypothetical protein DYB28_005803 [Aphanomyces astaci]